MNPYHVFGVQEGSHADIADNLFRHARGTITPTEVAGIRRYSGLNAAIQMLGTQAHRFGASLLADGQCAFEVIRHLAALRNTHGNKGVRETADAAVTLVLQEVGSTLVAHSLGLRSCGLGLGLGLTILGLQADGLA